MRKHVYFKVNLTYAVLSGFLCTLCAVYVTELATGRWGNLAETVYRLDKLHCQMCFRLTEKADTDLHTENSKQRNSQRLALHNLHELSRDTDKISFNLLQTNGERTSTGIMSTTEHE